MMGISSNCFAFPTTKFCLIMVSTIYVEVFSGALVQTSSNIYILENNKSTQRSLVSKNIPVDVPYRKFNENVENIFHLKSVDINTDGKKKTYLNLEADQIQFKTIRESDSKSNKARTGYQLTTPAQTPFVVLIFSEFARKLDTGGTAKQNVYTVGSLIHEQWVLTSASKIIIPYYKRTNVTVFAGVTTIAGVYVDQLPPQKESGSQSVLADKIYYHPEFDTDRKRFPSKYDFALIKLKKIFLMTDSVRTIRISPTGWTYNGSEKCKATGFGAVFGEGLGAHSSDDFRRKTHQLKVEMFQEPKNCRDIENPFLLSHPADGVGLCKGDYGAGLVCEGQVRAVFSNVMDLTATDSCLKFSNENAEFKCGSKNTISLFQDTCAFLPFVNDKVNLFKNGVMEGCRYIDDGIANGKKLEVDREDSRTNGVDGFEINFAAAYIVLFPLIISVLHK